MSGEQNQAGGPGGQAQDRQTNLADLHPSGDEIIRGARNEDQLDKMHETATSTTQGNSEEREVSLGDTTNLSPEQLQTAGNGNNQTLNDQNDLNEIRAADDLDEPDPEARYQATEAAQGAAADKKDNQQG
jgi:hypothetical protein